MGSPSHSRMCPCTGNPQSPPSADTGPLPRPPGVFTTQHRPHHSAVLSVRAPAAACLPACRSASRPALVCAGQARPLQTLRALPRDPQLTSVVCLPRSTTSLEASSVLSSPLSRFYQQQAISYRSCSFFNFLETEPHRVSDLSLPRALSLPAAHHFAQRAPSPPPTLGSLFLGGSPWPLRLVEGPQDDAPVMSCTPSCG